MQTSDHAIALARPKGMTPQRVTGLIFAGLLQAALILALIEGTQHQSLADAGDGNHGDRH